jgi:hypothetical protein
MRAHRIELDVAAAGEEIGAAVDRGGAIAAFPHRAGALVRLHLDCHHISAVEFWTVKLAQKQR